MKKGFFFNFICLAFWPLAGQEVLVLDTLNSIYHIDVSTCETKKLLNIQIAEKITAITLSKERKIFGLTDKGVLVEINAAGQVTLTHTFLNLQKFTALSASPDNLLWISGDKAFLYTYDLETHKETYLGDAGTSALINLFHHDSNLLALDERGYLRQIDPAAVHHEQIVYKFTTLPQGLTSIIPDSLPGCLIPRIYVMENHDGYTFDHRFARLDLPCNWPLATTYLTTVPVKSSPVPVIKDVRVRPADCTMNSGEIRVFLNLENQQFLYHLGDGTPQTIPFFTNLKTGQYLLTVENERHCSDSMLVTVPQVEPLKILQVESSPPWCSAGLGQVIVHHNRRGSVSYQISGQAVHTDSVFAGLTLGSYVITVIDSFHCTDSQTFEVALPDKIPVDFIISPSACGLNNGQIQIISAGSVTDWTWSVDGQLADSGYFFKHLSAGSHVVEIFSHKNCAIDTLVIIPETACELFLPNAFSPNGDGINDYFILAIPEGQSVEIKNLVIMDRWGAIILESHQIKASSQQRLWDGYKDGHLVNPGVYSYQLMVADNRSKHDQIYTGSITVIY